MMKTQPRNTYNRQFLVEPTASPNDRQSLQESRDFYTRDQWNSGLSNPRHSVNPGRPESGQDEPVLSPGKAIVVSGIYELSKKREAQARQTSDAQSGSIFYAIPENQRDRMFNEFTRAAASHDVGLLQACINRWQSAGDFYKDGTHPLRRLAGSHAKDLFAKEYKDLIELARQEEEAKYLNMDHSETD